MKWPLRFHTPNEATLLFILTMLWQTDFAQTAHATLLETVTRSNLAPMPEYFDRYINRVDDVSLKDAFTISIQQLDYLDLKKMEAIGSKVYAPGKWTVKDILQHIIDAERILDYRVLRFARNDTTAAPDFDQDEIALNAKTSTRSLSELLAE